MTTFLPISYSFRSLSAPQDVEVASGIQTVTRLASDSARSLESVVLIRKALNHPVRHVWPYGSLDQENSTKKSNQTVGYTLDIHGEKPLPVLGLKDRIQDLARDAKVISFGEEHDLNRDESFSEILDYEDVVLFLYREVSSGHMNLKTATNFVCEKLGVQGRLDGFQNLLIKILSVETDELLTSHTTRFFALKIIPVLSTQGFKDIIIEEFDVSNPERTMKLSKDKIGILLTVLMAVFSEMKIHGATGNNFLNPGKAISDAFKSKIKEIHKERPNAKIITFNGGVHNLTKPYEGVVKGLLGIEIDLSTFSFGDDLRRQYGRSFVSVDLVSAAPHGEGINSHYDALREKADSFNIMEVHHSDGQVAFVFPV